MYKDRTPFWFILSFFFFLVQKGRDAVCVAVIFNPLKNLIRNFIFLNSEFYRGKYDFYLLYIDIDYIIFWLPAD
jgi:hypothetical protein